jgi:hypothetical protein
MTRSLRQPLAALACAVLVLAISAPVRAHGLRSGFVDLEEVGPGKALVHVKSGDPRVHLTLSVDDGCTLGDAPEGRLESTQILGCPDGALAGHTLTLDGLGPFVADAVMWARYADGSTHGQALTRQSTRWTLPGVEGFWTTARHYVGLGVEHIATGYDHLLFLLLLALALRSPRKVLLAETAFTLSHSLSFTATALGWVHVSQTAAEACIAWSLVLVALDVGRRQRRAGGDRSFRIAGLAFAFGLVHGLGFAGGLREIGLPDRDVGAALLGFAGGVELGQVVFLAALLLAAALLARIRPLRPALRPLGLVGAYGGGILAMFWLFQRLVLVIAPA